MGESKEITKTQNDNAKAKIVIPNPADDEEVSETTIQASVDRFIQEHPEGWSFEDESELRNNLAEDGLDISRVEVSSTIDEALRNVQDENEVEEPIPQMNQSAPSIAGAVEIDSLEREAAILEVQSRMAEIESAARIF